MPVSLGEWRVRIGTFIRRRKKEYDYNYFWNKLVNLIKRAKNVQSPEENNSECNTSPRTPQTRSQCDGPECDAVKESGSSCDVKSPGPNEVSNSESPCAENNGSPTANKINPVPDTTDVHIPVPRPCVEDELDNRHITINPPKGPVTQPFASVSRVEFRDFFLPVVENVQNWLTRGLPVVCPRNRRRRLFRVLIAVEARRYRGLPRV